MTITKLISTVVFTFIIIGTFIHIVVIIVLSILSSGIRGYFSARASIHLFARLLDGLVDIGDPVRFLRASTFSLANRRDSRLPHVSHNVLPIVLVSYPRRQ
jgi:hypothetical protein